MRFSAAFFLFPALCFAVVGCTCRPTVIERPRAISQEALLAKLHDRTQVWSTYEASVHIKAQSDKGKYRLRAVVAAQLPHLFRLECFTPLGQTAGVLVFNLEGASLWVPSEKVVYSSDQAETLIQYFLGVPLPLETFGYSLAASVPPDLRLGAMKPLPVHAGWTLSARDPAHDFDFTWDFLAQPPSLKTVTVRDGSLSYAIDYDPATELDAQGIPGKISFVSSQWQLEVKVDQMKPAARFQDAVFTQPFPAGIRRIVLDKAR